MPGGPTKTTQGWASCIPSLTTFSGETTAVNGDLAPWDFSLNAWRALRRQRIHKTALQTFFATVDGQNLAPPYRRTLQGKSLPRLPLVQCWFFWKITQDEKTNVNIESRGDRGEHKLVQDFGHQLYSWYCTTLIFRAWVCKSKWGPHGPWGGH